MKCTHCENEMKDWEQQYIETTQLKKPYCFKCRNHIKPEDLPPLPKGVGG